MHAGGEQVGESTHPYWNGLVLKNFCPLGLKAFLGPVESRGATIAPEMFPAHDLDIYLQSLTGNQCYMFHEKQRKMQEPGKTTACSKQPYINRL